MVPAPGERSELGGGRQSIAKFRSTDMVGGAFVLFVHFPRARGAPSGAANPGRALAAADFFLIDGGGGRGGRAMR
jgi:hypothetical protein